MRITALALLIIATLATAPAVHAQAPADPVVAGDSAAAEADAVARELFKVGRVAFDAGDYEVALERWEHAYGLSGQPKMNHNIGLAHERLGQIVEAIAAYERYLKWEPEDKEVRAHIVELRATMRAGNPYRELDLPDVIEPMQMDPYRIFDEPRAPQVTEAPQATEQPPRLLPLGLLAGGGVILATGTVTGILALQKDGELDDLCGRPRMCDPSDAREGRALASSIDTLSITTDVLLPLGALVAGVGSYLLWGVGDEKLQVSCTGDGCRGGTTWLF